MWQNFYANSYFAENTTDGVNIMRKVGYFFYTFVPLLAVEAIQTVAMLFMYGTGILGQLLIGKLVFPSASITDRVADTLTSSDFNIMIMVIYSLITIAIFGMWYYARFGGEYLPSPKKIFHPLMIAAIVVLVPGTQFAAGYIANFTAIIRPDWYAQYSQLFDSSGINDLTFLTVLYSVILAPVCEELIFRGVTMRCARKALPFWLANIMQAALFGLFHLNWIQGIYAFALGIVLGYVCERGGSIYYSIGLHFLFNLWGTLSVFLPDTESTAVAITVTVVTIVSLVAGFVMFYVGRKKRDHKPIEVPVEAAI